MSDTPRTDGFLNETSEQFHDTAWIEHSCQLERELNAEKQHITELEGRLRVLWDKLDGERKHYQDRINRLEETGDALMEIVEGARSKRWNVNGFRLKDTPEWVQFYVSFRKAKRSKWKEAKP